MKFHFDNIPAMRVVDVETWQRIISCNHRGDYEARGFSLYPCTRTDYETGDMVQYWMNDDGVFALCARAGWDGNWSLHIRNDYFTQEAQQQ